ncbi:hypothetical protein VE02_10008 [Pseudogymnoascus sp. 03VT05]|nr:hypothetical protein VE02_10008 [Pseudogymnoascus sp. 03VT05]
MSGSGGGRYAWSPHAVPASTEVAYCKVKLFRTHGAELKLSNDVAHVKNTICRFKQQTAQSEADMKDIKKPSASTPSPSLPRPRTLAASRSTNMRYLLSLRAQRAGHGPVGNDLRRKLQQQAWA